MRWVEKGAPGKDSGPRNPKGSPAKTNNDERLNAPSTLRGTDRTALERSLTVASGFGANVNTL
jgi:hypothetical protein